MQAEGGTNGTEGTTNGTEKGACKYWELINFKRIFSGLGKYYK